jgi:chromosomal replication initiator protein
VEPGETPANQLFLPTAPSTETAVVGPLTRCYARPSLSSSEEPGRRVEQPIELTAETLWTEVAGRLKGALNDSTYRTWFGEVEGMEVTDDTFVLAVPNDFTREWIEGHFLELIRAAVRDATGQERRVQLTVAETGAVPDATQAPAQRISESGLNTKYTFDLFVIGSSNRFAHAAALAVAEAPAQAYNPLFIYGSTGLGKTHLLQAIAQYVMEHPGSMSVRYVTSESFVNDFINSLRDKRIEGFKQRYRNYDLLLIDDVQFFEGKERFQEEFFHTFNSLYESGSQIVLSSDRPPKEIATLEARLRSRFEWGLITDIQPPDLETRIAILRKKVKTDGIHIADPQLLTFIAGRISTNIRELEGALTRVVAFASLTGRPMTADLAQDVLKDVFPQGEVPQVTIEHIQEVVCDRFGLSLDELCSHKRSQNIVYPRQVAMYLSRELTDSSLPKIGKHFGDRDHTTVLHANTKITNMIRADRTVYNLVQELTARIKHVR